VQEDSIQCKSYLRELAKIKNSWFESVVGNRGFSWYLNLKRTSFKQTPNYKIVIVCFFTYTCIFMPMHLPEKGKKLLYKCRIHSGSALVPVLR